MSKLKFNTKTKFHFNVKLNTIGNSASEKLDCIKKIEAIVNQKNGTATTFESLPYSRGGKYRRHTSTLTDVITFEFDKESNSVTESHTSNSANRPTFSVEVYSDLWLAKKNEELLSKVSRAEAELNSFKAGIGKDYLKAVEYEKQRKEDTRIAQVEKMAAEKTARIASGEQIVESVDEFATVFAKTEQWLKLRAEMSEMVGSEKNQRQCSQFNRELKEQNITIEGNDRLFWYCFKASK
jgi:hypothetical protein